MLNQSALVFLAVYILCVVYQGNTQNLFSELKKEQNFVFWLVAVVAVYQIEKSKVLGASAHYIIALTFIGFLIGSGQSTKFLSFVTNTFKGQSA